MAAARINVVDEEDRRYFKQQEITLWRKVPAGLSLTPQTVAALSSFEGEREIAARADAERSEAEVRKANKKKKKSKKDKPDDDSKDKTDKSDKPEKQEKPAADTTD